VVNQNIMMKRHGGVSYLGRRGEKRESSREGEEEGEMKVTRPIL
jgi:hypothetical protein